MRTPGPEARPSSLGCRRVGREIRPITAGLQLVSAVGRALDRMPDGLGRFDRSVRIRSVDHVHRQAVGDQVVGRLFLLSGNHF